ncbi:Sec8 exocyst complex component-specific domain-containing protein [Boletus edulis BED1]|uniref:Exocyst complex component Sec8 n=1 Tax=Boletus edulis BED1 TaxID=1328754 RepID=A0AAD4C1E5_BOLED|nr:Sec8 exocyst complex component-specific domain-containing protein [Boletus edulis BED1]
MSHETQPTSRRARAPSISSPLPNPLNYPTSLPATRPLQIARPSTPSNTTFSSASSPKAPPFSSPNRPHRPQRSDLRPRQPSDYSASERTSTSSRIINDLNTRERRDSSSTTLSDVSIQHRPIGSISLPTKPRLDPPRSTTSELSVFPLSSTTPSSAMTAAMAAFRDAGEPNFRRRELANGNDENNYELGRRSEAERERARQDRMPYRKPTVKTKSGEIDAILDQIKDEWEFVVNPDFNNADLALSLLDETSTGKNISSFRKTKEMLSQALKGSVDQHYKAFADALPHHAALLNHLGQAQAQVQETRVALQETKESLGSKRADLVQLWVRGQTLEEMMRLLDQIEHLKSVPDALEALISEKRLVQASVLLIRSLKLINNSDMQEIGAVTDLRVYLVGQETALRDILVDELHNHLYLKSFWCETRWAHVIYYLQPTRSVPKVELEDQLGHTNAPSSSIRAPSTNFYTQGTRLSHYLNALATRPNDAPYDLNDANFRTSTTLQELSAISATLSSSSNLGMMTAPSAVHLASPNVNPEADSFTYIETLLESLAILGKLGNALDSIMQRLPGEIFSLIESTVDEIEERVEESKRSSAHLTTPGLGSKADGGYIIVSDDSATMSSVHPTLSRKTESTTASTLRLAALESTSQRLDQEILKDLFWSIYSKLDAITQGLRVVFEVANRIGSRRDFKDSSGAKPGTFFPIADVWLSIQAEVRILLNDYLTDEERSAVAGRNPITSINEVLREGRFTRDRNKGIFRFADTDTKSTGKFLRRHEHELMRVLRDTMPGLVQSSSENTVQSALSSLGSDERILGAGQHHRLLIKPDAFHVSVLFQPTLAFLGRVKNVLPDGVESAQSASEVLDDFVLKVYLPQLEEKISLLFHYAVSAPDAFQPDVLSTRFSPRPILKAATQLMALINSLCAMLRTTPFHRENYSRLIVGVIIQFYQRCSHRFQALVSKDGTEGPSSPSLAAQWAQKSELSPCLSELFLAENRVIKQQLCRQESHLEMGYLAECTVDKGDLNPATRNIAALCSLYRSVAWFTQELDTLKSSPEGIQSPASTLLHLDPVSTLPSQISSPTHPFKHQSSKNNPLSLPLSHEMALRFGALLKTYTQLAEIILHSIRIEVRCRAIYYLDAAFRHGNYQVDHEVGEPDPYIVDLNSELSHLDDFTSTSLLKNEQSFVFFGLEDLVEELLIKNARTIRVANDFGMKKVDRNIRALQQCIRTIGDGEQFARFEKVRQYYALFSLGPQSLLDNVRTNKTFSFDEYKVILNLQCGVDQSLGDSAASRAADRNYGMYSIELHGLELECAESNP